MNEGKQRRRRKGLSGGEDKEEQQWVTASVRGENKEEQTRKRE